MQLKDRAELVRKYCYDEDVTFKEAYAHLYHWMVAEYAYIVMVRARRVHLKHAAILRQDLRVLNFRKDLRNL